MTELYVFPTLENEGEALRLEEIKGDRKRR
jgi:hypothetical protein